MYMYIYIYREREMYYVYIYIYMYMYSGAARRGAACSMPAASCQELKAWFG